MPSWEVALSRNHTSSSCYTFATRLRSFDFTTPSQLVRNCLRRRIRSDLLCRNCVGTVGAAVGSVVGTPIFYRNGEFKFEG